MTHVAIDTAPALLWGFYTLQDWQRSLNGLAALDALDKLIGKPQTATCPPLSWAWGVNADGTPKYQEFYGARLEADRQKGRVPVLTWMQHNGGARTDPAQILAFNNESVLAGKHDAYLGRFGAAAVTYGRRFVVRLNPEANGWWEGPFSEYDSSGKLANGNTDGSFVRGWRYIVDKVRAAGGTNIQWHWCANTLSASGPTSAAKLLHFYPGDTYCDFVGYDVYNKAVAGPNLPWLTFQQCLEGRTTGWPVNSLGPMLALAPGKPWILGEVGCGAATPNDATPGAGDQATWISDMLTLIPSRYPFIKAVLYFNAYGWTIEDKGGAAGFTKGLASDSYPAAPLLDAEQALYRLVATPDLDNQTAALVQQLVASQASLTDLQNQNAALQQQLAAAQAGDQSDAGQIAELNQKLQEAEDRAAAAEARFAEVQANLQALVRLGSGTTP
jgi:hypothetical protein